MFLAGLNGWMALGLVIGVMGIFSLIWWLATMKSHKAKRAITLETKSTLPTQEEKPVGKYSAIILNEVINFHGLIEEVMGAIFTPDGTMPEAGKGHYLVIDKALTTDGKYKAYEPREGYHSELIPEKLFRAVFRWLYCLPYRNPPSFWEKLPTLIAYLVIAITFIFGLIVLGGKG